MQTQKKPPWKTGEQWYGLGLEVTIREIGKRFRRWEVTAIALWRSLGLETIERRTQRCWWDPVCTLSFWPHSQSFPTADGSDQQQSNRRPTIKFFAVNPETTAKVREELISTPAFQGPSVGGDIYCPSPSSSCELSDSYNKSLFRILIVVPLPWMNFTDTLPLQ